MGYYRTCTHCGANLDPGETCDCQEESKVKESRVMALCACDASGQITMKVEDFKYAET